ncbi:hypothetical protein THIX_60890 [Thiomonas sp. X19]|uniref:Uncharacterized protein n=1 Tax=mine drainage metagenome TaxID=410659 RepID=E6PNE3_9ZZZZ|nr:hypothetical protein THIX_60890 [Thiomonas sp. X19]
MPELTDLGNLQLRYLHQLAGFNPRPGFNPSETLALKCFTSRAGRFNPRPGFNPSETLDRAGVTALTTVFQSTPGF